MVKAAEIVRRQEHRRLSAAGAGTFTGTEYPWLFIAEYPPGKHRPKFEDLTEINLKVGKAWSIKESLQELCGYPHTGLARRFFKKWYAWACRNYKYSNISWISFIRNIFSKWPPITQLEYLLYNNTLIFRLANSIASSNSSSICKCISNLPSSINSF